MSLATTMKAAMQTAYAETSKSLQILDVPVPSISDDPTKILLRVKAVSINPLDYLYLHGGLKMVFTEPFPVGVGCDVSGVVVKAGEESGFKEGDEVFGCLNLKARGSMAEYCWTYGRNCALKPKSLTHEEAACLPVAGMTSLQAFSRHEGPRDTAFIPAGMGGVGSIALQLAKPIAGFKRTVTTASTAKVPLVKEHIKDVDEVVDYKTVDPASVIPAHSCDFILDPFGKPQDYVRFTRKPDSTKSGDGAHGKPSIISILAPPCADKAQEGWEIRAGVMVRVAFNTMDWWTRTKIPSWVHYDSFFALPRKEDMEVMAKLADEGRLKPVIDRVFSLDQAVEAFALAESRPAGKVVVRCSSD